MVAGRGVTYRIDLVVLYWLRTMASQVVELDGFAEFDLYIRGYHAHSDIWSPVVGEILLLKREPDNLVDASAVAVWKEDKIVGHVPYNIASVISQFLRRDCNKGFVQVTGNKVNRGAGYGLEVPCTTPCTCTYRLYGPRPFI